jgi:hypothetical protein
MFKIGDTVSFLDEPGGGTVTAVAGDKITVEDDFGFEDEHAAHSLILKKAMNFNAESVPQKDPVSRKGSAQNLNFAKPNFLECDLHFGQLVAYPKNYGSHQKLQIQLNEAQKTLEKARRAGIKKVILIHGVGQGRLKEEVHSLLERMDRLTFFDASFAEYGSGATEVQLL